LLSQASPAETIEALLDLLGALLDPLLDDLRDAAGDALLESILGAFSDGLAGVLDALLGLLAGVGGARLEVLSDHVHHVEVRGVVPHGHVHVHRRVHGVHGVVQLGGARRSEEEGHGHRKASESSRRGDHIVNALRSFRAGPLPS